MEKNEPPHFPFMYEGKNYLLKMRKDNAFLGFKDNPFLKVFNFTDRGDPFLILPSCNYKGVGHLKKRKNGKKNFTGLNKDLITIPIEHSLLKKIKKIEVVLDEEHRLVGKGHHESH